MLTFLDIVGGTEGKDKLQVIVDTQYLKDTSDLLPSDIHRGDIIGPLVSLENWIKVSLV